MTNYLPITALDNYLPVLIFMIIGGVVGVAAPLIGYLIGPKRSNPSKTSPYECGFEPFDDARMPFDVRYYLVAILFIIFDLETAFLVPWAVVFRKTGWFGMAAMAIFLGLLVIGFIYEWKKGALEWE
ncbi:MAG: NADH-quinone oxidoreductase subunit [uncultured bacterium]|nr:MAG: NADH-quinone oxidoreductase subunit [uncultured bacterium]